MVRPTSAAGRTELGRPLLALYNAAYWPYLMTSCAGAFFGAAGVYALTRRDPKLELLGRYTAEWGAHYLEKAPFAGVTVLGREEAPTDRACVYVANHQSMVDVLAIFSARLPMLWVSKVENFRVPFLGWAMSLNGFIELKRGHLPSILRMVRTCLRKLSDGHSIFVFPEGTRSPDGELIPFYSGAFRIARRAGVPVVPIVIDGTGDILPKGSFTIRPRPVTLSILPPMYAADFGGDAKRLQAEVRAAMHRELCRLRGKPIPAQPTVEGATAGQSTRVQDMSASSRYEPSNA